ncbi:MAG: cobaltochelatase subunit CobT, partial [Pseudomonadota bacterium]
MAGSSDALERAIGCTVRAIARQPNLEVNFRGGQRAGKKGQTQSEGSVKLNLPSRNPSPVELARIRGEADRIALRRCHHDADVHRRNAPRGELASKLFESLEQLRVEAKGAEQMLGVKMNLSAVHRARTAISEIGEDSSGTNIADVVELFARRSLMQFELAPAEEEVVNNWSGWLTGQLAIQFDELRGSVADQERFGAKVRDLLQELGLMDELSENPEDSTADENDESNQPADGPSEAGESEADGEDLSQEMSGRSEADLDTETDQNDEAQEADADENADLESAGGDSSSADDRSNRPNYQAPHGVASSYRIYTIAHDEIVEADELCGASELTRLRAQLDQSLRRFEGMIGRMANRLQRKLLAQQTRAWEFDLEEGILDAARLARIVANPTVPLSYKVERQTEFRDTIVNILIDNSGSMRGRPISVAAMSADILTRTLERCGVKVEILGFTTKAWKGGQARESWLREGKPGNPGRLNDLRHI